MKKEKRKESELCGIISDFHSKIFDSYQFGNSAPGYPNKSVF